MLKNPKFNKNVFKSKSGISLVEVLVAFGILAIIVTGVTSPITGGMKQQKGMQTKISSVKLLLMCEVYLAIK